MLLKYIFKRKLKAKHLLDYMKKNNLSRKELAKELGITEAYLSYFFNGKRTFGTKAALRISQKTGIPIENLIQ